MYYLYIKQHNQTKLRYLGQTKSDPYKYKGSGTFWMRHLRKYGNAVTTEVLVSTEDYDELVKWGLFYSQKYDVVKDRGWANLKEENGIGGFDHINNENKQLYVKKTASTINNWTNEKRAEVAAKKANKGTKNGMYGTCRAGVLNPRWGADVTDDTKKKISMANKGKKRSDEVKQMLSDVQKTLWTPERRRATSERLKNSGHKPPSPKGLLWWKKGDEQIRSKESPGVGWIRGRIKNW